MAIIIETCPKCGHDLHDVMLASNPPIPKKECFNCGWSWQGEPEQVIRIPFGGNSFNHDDLTLNGNTDYECVNGLATTITTCGDNAISINEAIDALIRAFKEYEDKFMKESMTGAFEQSACVNCSNNPKNGGSGVCFCTLGQQAIY